MRVCVFVCRRLIVARGRKRIHANYACLNSKSVACFPAGHGHLQVGLKTKLPPTHNHPYYHLPTPSNPGVLHFLRRCGSSVQFGAQVVQRNC